MALRLLLLLTTGLCAAAAPPREQQCSAADPGCPSSPRLTKFGALPVTARVPRRVWDRSDPGFVHRLRREGRPVILTGSPADDWPAMQEWSPEWLLDAFGGDLLLPCFFTKKGNYLYYSHAKAEKWGESYRRPHSAKRVKLRNFLAAARRSKPGKPKYYFNMLISPENPLYPQIEMIDPRPFMPADDAKGRVAGEGRAHFWFGPAGVRTRLHYDMSHNLFVQLFGHKTFFLAPPKVQRQLPKPPPRPAPPLR